MGIGTASPSGTLHLRDTTPKIYIQSNDGNDAIIVFGDAADASRGQIKYTSSDDLLFLNNNLNERMRINSSGNVKVGNGSTITASTNADDFIIGDLRNPKVVEKVIEENIY